MAFSCYLYISICEEMIVVVQEVDAEISYRLYEPKYRTHVLSFTIASYNKMFYIHTVSQELSIESIQVNRNYEATRKLVLGFNIDTLAKDIQSVLQNPYYCILRNERK